MNSQQPDVLRSCVSTYGFDQAEVRTAEIDINEPISHVVRLVAPGLLAGVSALTIIRTLTLQNFDNDDRPLVFIPEARAYCKNLWADGKQLLRLLIESTFDAPPDDRPGLTNEELMSLGLGWWEVYCIGSNKSEWLVPKWARPDSSDAAALDPGVSEARRKAHDELFHEMDRGLFGYTPEAAAKRLRLFDALQTEIAAMLLAKTENDLEGDTIVIVSLADEQGAAIDRQLKAGGLSDDIPSMTVSSTYKLFLVRREIAAVVLADVAPNIVAALHTDELSPRQCWVVVTAEGGSQLTRLGAT